MKAFLISKPLLIPLMALIAASIALTVATAAILGNQTNVPNYVPPTTPVQNPEKPSNNTDTKNNIQNQTNAITPITPINPIDNDQNIINTPTPMPTLSILNRISNFAIIRQNSLTSTLNIAVYEDGNGTKTCSNIAWGGLKPGGELARIIYVKNTGYVSATLSLSTLQWVPINAANKLSLTWDQEGTMLPPEGMVVATLKLAAAENTGDLTDFSMNIVISGST